MLTIMVIIAPHAPISVPTMMLTAELSLPLPPLGVPALCAIELDYKG